MKDWNFVSHDKIVPARNATASIVNTGSNHVTVWVKYGLVSKTSSTPILTDINASQWEDCHYSYGCDWKDPVCADGLQPFAKLTPNPDKGCNRIGLCIKYTPANTATNFISSLGWSYNSPSNTKNKLTITNAVDAYHAGTNTVNVIYENIVLSPTNITSSDPTYFSNPLNGVQSGCGNSVYIYLDVGKTSIKK
jgi:hypothetical protein